MKRNKGTGTEKKHKFILFVSGMSVKSMNAIDNLRKIGETHLNSDYELEIIDINKQKHQAMQYQIFALPTLIRIKPDPRRVILGDLSETQKVLKILNIIQ